VLSNFRTILTLIDQPAKDSISDVEVRIKGFEGFEEFEV
jgi:hypothetical protein